MNASPIRFCCPTCQARIKAPAQLRGQGRNCPGCGNRFTVPRSACEDVGPILVSLESEEYSWRMAYRRGA